MYPTLFVLGAKKKCSIPTHRMPIHEMHPWICYEISWIKMTRPKRNTGIGKVWINEIKRNGSHCVGRATNRCLFTGAIPLLLDTGTFACCDFHPGPVRPSLDNLVTQGSPSATILMPSLVRTPDRHRTPEGRTPALKRSTTPGLLVARLQEHATTPSRF